MQVFTVPVGADGCGYYRSYLPHSHLARWGGHEVSMPPHGITWLPEVEINEHQIDVLAGQLISGPVGMALWEEWSGHAKLVYDIDDDIFNINFSRSAFVAYPDLVEIARYLLALSDLVTVSTAQMAEVVAPYNDAVQILPNYIHSDLLDIERPRRDKVTVGWTPSTSHERDADFIAEPLRRFLKRNPKAEYHGIGMDYRDTIRIPGRHTTWLPDLWDYYRAIDFDIGIAPLEPNTFNRSKSALKALEYAALGIPVVASDAEPYRDFVLDGVTGFLVNQPHEWEKRLRELTNDEQMRAEMGAKARELASHWTIQDHWVEWERAYEGADLHAAVH